MEGFLGGRIGPGPKQPNSLRSSSLFPFEPHKGGATLKQRGTHGTRWGGCFSSSALVFLLARLGLKEGEPAKGEACGRTRRPPYGYVSAARNRTPQTCGLSAWFPFKAIHRGAASNKDTQIEHAFEAGLSKEPVGLGQERCDLQCLQQFRNLNEESHPQVKHVHGKLNLARRARHMLYH